jgi:isopentenyl-diphosphate delta-isomerase
MASRSLLPAGNPTVHLLTANIMPRYLRRFLYGILITKMEEEQIVFVDEDGTATGETGPKLASHTATTKLHLAFSCYIFNPKTKHFLLTQRAHVKKVWPDVWTNSVCGHPMPGEAIEAAIRRRAEYELGIEELDDLQCLLPKYVYKTPPYNGIIEHEFCPIYIALTDQEPAPNPQEVDAFKWITWEEYGDLLEADTDKNTMSYWAKDQFPRISAQIESIFAA